MKEWDKKRKYPAKSYKSAYRQGARGQDLPFHKGSELQLFVSRDDTLGKVIDRD